MALREQCEKIGITLTELAQRANMRLTALSKVEHGRRQLSLREGARIAKILQCDTEDLLKPIYPNASTPVEALEHG